MKFSSNYDQKTPYTSRTTTTTTSIERPPLQQQFSSNSIIETPNYNETKIKTTITDSIPTNEVLQKNQNEILQKLLFQQQQQNTEFDSLKNQQEQIQNIVSQYHPLSPSKANLLNKIQENENQSTGGASD
ncbi:hypothetical protein DICPUDRAFT_152537 [Dictyostelium purpureum]|uniref:Uncharacterized protein n=1 Tax=Dictyostelium purpureum TaxID=5786 RepID=F0ZLM1_DICPU|nr:uncharacterized protein DICPUDRAFT_152537 [Dictyostelium purpureum]EGC35163.1 hypothetical protein DICPUDRAFT_152537 [Dictyostelium purpureum]|eukprot:XP_003288301.1 hypothetical protein DICPUDRAFT_152537 [Dictyostelium purpureum]